MPGPALTQRLSGKHWIHDKSFRICISCKGLVIRRKRGQMRLFYHDILARKSLDTDFQWINLQAKIDSEPSNVWLMPNDTVRISNNIVTIS